MQLSLDANLRRLLRAPEATDDKYSRGVVGFVTGSNKYPGAAILGVRAALATSIGMVKYVGPVRVQDLMLVTNPESVCFDTATEAGRANAWVIGSGVPADDALQQRNYELVFFTSGAVAVLDAGALESLDIDLLRKHRLILTPHFAELARLLNKLDGTREHSAESVRDNAVTLALETAQRLGQTILLKGNTTLIADPNEGVRAIGPNSAHLATAGTGDVLAGLLGAIAAANPNETSWMDTAELAVRLHSAAADLASETGAVTASSIVDALAQLCRKLAQ